MKVRQATYREIKVGAELLYCKKDGFVVINVVIIGFVPMYVGPSQKDKEHTLCAVRQKNGLIILVEDQQLFVRAD